MRRAAAAIALAALAAAPGAAGAQFRARPMVIPAPGSLPNGEQTWAMGQPFASAADADLLVAHTGASPSLRLHHALLAPIASPYAQPASFDCVASGQLAQNGGDARPDVAYCVGAGQIQIAYGNAPGTLRSYAHALDTPDATLTFVRLHPAPRQTDVLVFPVNTGMTDPALGELYALDFATDGALLPEAEWAVGGITKRGVLPDEVLPIRISATARALGIDDLYLPGRGSVTIVAHAAPPVDGTLAGLRPGPSVFVGGTGLEPGVDPTTFLPPGVTPDDVLGAAALDVDFDGVLDLVLSMSPAYRYTSSYPTGRLLWIKGTGAVADFATTKPWGDLTFDPELEPLVDPAFLRGFDLGGEPAIALFDRGSDAVLVIRSDPGARRLLVWRGSAAGRLVRDFRLVDVAGSPAPDLVGDATWRIAGSPAAPPAILVWPDVADASPEIAWAAGSPGAPVRGEDLSLAVTARDPDGTFAVDWMVGDPLGAPVASSAGLAGGAPVDVPWVLDGALLCATPPQTVVVTARATDAFGVFDEISATLDVASRAPALALAGGLPPDRLELRPGGTVLTIDGSAWARCGPVSFAWTGSALDLPHSVTAGDGPGTTRLTLDLQEASYPALLAGGDPSAALVATDASTGLQSPAAALDLALDARGLVEIEHAADVVALQPGEVGVVRTVLRSRIGVALPDVHVVDVLAGLAPAGAPRAQGAAIVGTAAGGAEVVLDLLPASDREVVLELPVRSLGERGASAVEARSSGGHLLTPAGEAGAPGATAPGCGCGGGGAGVEALLAVALLAARRRRAT